MMTHPTDDELETMAERLEASAFVRSPAYEVQAAAMLRACKGVTAALEARAEKAEAERDALRAAINRAGALACQRASHAFIIDALKDTDT